ncbi:MAG: squalene--hopene cyclase [Planctomycetes bacterium]|nr:squalene--hopene cyclase [Planctomycetota bacterium]
MVQRDVHALPTGVATRRAVTAERTDVTDLTEALDRARQALLGRQDAAGWWQGEDEANQTLDAQYIFLLHYTGLLARPEYQDKARRLANWIRRTQRPDGTWAIYHDAPGCLSVTTESYAALKLMGDPADAPHMVKAREFILAGGGPAKTRVLTKFELALLGELPWEACPSIPIQFILMPGLSRFNIYELAYWARVCTVPLAILADQKKVVPVPPGRGIAELFSAPATSRELYEGHDPPLVSWGNFFLTADKVLKWADRRRVLPLREVALRRAERWILEHQDDAGDWGGIFPAIANSLLALFVRGMSVEDERFKKGMAALERFEWPDAARDETHIAPCVSPVWDTAWTVLGLVEGGLAPDHPAVSKALRWLAKMQIRRKGDWARKAPHVPAGGWAFQFFNDFYPDTDDSAVVVMALMNAGADLPDKAAVIERGVRWITGLQNADGGWGAFERDVDDVVYNEILYNDEKNMLDPSTVDVTGRILEMLGHLGVTRRDPVVERAEAYVRREQEPDGKWWGRWGVNYVYGTWSVVRGLAAIGVGPDDPAMQRAADWLERYQQADGGWGESCASYLPGHEAETIPPTASQTAWGVMGLIACGRAKSEAVARGVRWLIEHQAEHGLWDEAHFTGTGFPNAFYLKYHMYPCYFPVLALGAYRNAIGG